MPNIFRVKLQVKKNRLHGGLCVFGQMMKKIYGVV
jgi:hypothetical protein